MFFICIKITSKKTRTPETIAPQGISKNTHGQILPTKIRLKWWPKHGKKNAKLAILKGLGWKHIGPERKPPRKTTFVIWSYDYRFVRGKMVYVRIGMFFTIYKQINSICYYFRPDAVQYCTALFSPARLFSGRSGSHQACMLQHLF